MRLLIIGIGGFIGSSLTERIVSQRPDWKIYGLDPCFEKITHLQTHPNLFLQKGAMADNQDWMKAQLPHVDAVLPLAAIANPELYVKDPLRVFKLDFEENLQIIRDCVAFKKHIIFPSTSEVYGMCEDKAYDEDTSLLTTGPIHKERWIYASSKQLLDRLIYAYGKHEGLSYTLFRPFNWIGAKLDHLTLEGGGQGRSLVQFLGHIFQGKDILITGDGTQRRSFTDIDDALDALMTIIENYKSVSGQVFNIGNPKNDISIKDYAEKLKNIVLAHPNAPQEAAKSHVRLVAPEKLFGAAYQDVQRRVPSIQKAQQKLHWQPETPLAKTLEKIVAYHIERLFGDKTKKDHTKGSTHAA